MPLGFGALPSLQVTPEHFKQDVVASPEWFGDGCQSFREILVQRELGELLAGQSPRDFRLREPPRGASDWLELRFLSRGIQLRAGAPRGSFLDEMDPFVTVCRGCSRGV